MGPRDLEAYCRGGQGPPRAVAPSGRNYFIMLMLGSTCIGHHFAPSSGAHDDSVGYRIGRLVLELLMVGSLSEGRMDEFPDRRL